MKLYKSYILAGLIALGFTACNTDDLERDINALKDRVENYEAQVQKLNDDMNIIRVMLDGNKTISEWSYDGSKYTLKLSNGETLTLSNGVVGDTNYPSIEISENGNWIIAGEDTGIRAVAKDGEDAEFTPQFKIENGNWFVSHDDGTTWTDLEVSATGTPTDATSPISGIDTSDPNYITITLASGNYSIPVVKNLTCAIQKTDLADDGLLYLDYGGDGKIIKVEVNIESGDIIRPVVPADWKAEIVTDYSTSTGPKTLDVKVTAPNNASKCVVTIEVNRGATTITDEIVARTKTMSYYDDFMAGLDIEIGGTFVNKRMFSSSDIHAPENSQITLSGKTNGIYFLNSDADKGAKITANITNVNELVIIGDTPGEMPTITLSGNYYISMNNNEGGLGLLLKNVSIDASERSNYLFNIGNAYVDENTYYNYLIFDKCKISWGTGNTLTYINNESKKMPIQNIHICNSMIYSAKAEQRYVFSFSNHEYQGFDNFTVENSVFYCNTANERITNFSLLQCANSSSTGFDNIKVKNNTFVNIVPANQLVKVKMSNVDFSNNLIWCNSDVGGYLLNAIKGSEFGTTNFNNNFYYNSVAGDKSYSLFHEDGVVPENITNKLSSLSENPFGTDGLDIANSKFELLPEYQSIGAHF